MKCVYINLESATARRESVERSFRAAAPPGWDLIRLPALEPADVVDVAGACSLAEKACFMSHRAAIASCLDSEEAILVVEDDVLFSRHTFEMAERILASPSSWDLMYTEIHPSDVAAMVALAKQWKRLASTRQFLLQDLSRTRYAGASGYLIGGGAKRRLIAELDTLQAVDLAYDLVLRDLVHSGRMQARVCFPFLTAPAPHAEVSSIQPQSVQTRDAILSAFRRLMFVDRERDLADTRRGIERLQSGAADEGAELVGRVLGLLISDLFPDKW